MCGDAGWQDTGFMPRGDGVDDMWHLFSISPSPLTILTGAASGSTMALPINRANIGAKPDPAYEIRLLSDGHSPVTHMDLSGIHRMIEHENAPALPEGPHAPGERHQRLPDATLAHSGILEQANYAL